MRFTIKLSRPNWVSYECRKKLSIDPKCHRPFETLIGTHTKKNDIFKLQKMQINHTKNRADFKSPYA